MMQNVRVTAFTVSELLRENQQGQGGAGGGEGITQITVIKATYTCSKSTLERLEKGVKYVPS